MEHTFLLHVAAPGERPKVLYWYRTAPGLRLGRPALDEGAMRTLEEQHPDIDFDWPYILEVGAMTPVEVEAPLPPRKRKPRPAEPDDLVASPDGAVSAVDDLGDAVPPPDAEDSAPSTAPVQNDLLTELLGRGIATSLRTRHADLAARIETCAAPPEAKLGWRHRLAALDPDRWTTPDAVLAGMATVDHDLETLSVDIERASTS